MSPKASVRHLTPLPPLQPTILPCAKCGVAVLVSAWGEGQWRELETPVTPVLGMPHACATHKGVSGTDATPGEKSSLTATTTKGA